MKVALRLFAAEGVEDLELLNTLDAFSNGAQAVRACQGNDRGDNGLTFRQLSQVTDEGTIDFEAVDRELAQVAERGARHGEIVNSNADALPAQGIQSVSEVLPVVPQSIFGDFDVDVSGVGGVARLLEELRDELLAIEFCGREVDGDSHRWKTESMPMLEVASGLGENPFADGYDETGSFEDR